MGTRTLGTVASSIIGIAALGGAAGCFLSKQEDDTGSSDHEVTASGDVSQVLKSTLILKNGCIATKVGPKHLLIAARCVVGNDAFAAGKTLMQKMKLDSLLITRGRHGMVVFSGNQTPVDIPIHGTDEIADVTGAGDTVIAAFTAALATGADPIDAAHLANFAGGIVVMKRGTATASAEELREAIEESANHPPPKPVS